MRRFISASSAIVIAIFASTTSARACDGYRVVRQYPTQHVVCKPVVTRVVETQVVAPAPVQVVQQTINVVKVDTRPLVTAGSTLQSRALFLGDQPGFVFLKFAGVRHRCQIQSWSSEQAMFDLPLLDVADEVAATLELVRSDGTLVKSHAIRLVSPPSLAQVERPVQLSVVAPAPVPQLTQAFLPQQ
ncbi:MAG: hypothetical protein KDB22_12920 [Planctomycetales bacterium]|nr:hypothetical protein [Planctomycetales bacterium]